MSASDKNDEKPVVETTGSDNVDNDAGSPLLRVVRGEPDESELAALTAIVAGLAAGGEPEEDEQPARSRWADRAAAVGRSPAPGPGAWRASAFRR